MVPQYKHLSNQEGTLTGQSHLSPEVDFSQVEEARVLEKGLSPIWGQHEAQGHTDRKLHTR